MSSPRRAPKGGIYGHLAILKLCQIAAYDATLGDAAKRVLMLFAGYANPQGCCWPSITKMAKSLCLTRAAVTNQLKILEEHEYIKRTARFSSGTHARATNLVTLNLPLAQQFRAEPEIFCQRNLATLLPDGGVQFHQIASTATSKGCINKTSLIKQINNPTQNKPDLALLNRHKIHASAWEQEKEREKTTGITASHKERLNYLFEEMEKFKNARQMTAFDLEVNREINGIAPLKAIEIKIEKYEQELACLEARSIENTAVQKRGDHE